MQAIRDLIHTCGLTRIAEDPEALLAHSVRLWPRPVESDTLETGASRFGGVPDLPPRWSWPEWQGVPQAFLAQLAMSEVAPYDVEGVLPHSGILYFFYDVEEWPWGFDPAHRGGWRVLHYEGDMSLLRRRQHPAELPDHGRFAPCALGFDPAVSLPVPHSRPLQRLALNEGETDRYESLWQQVMESDEDVPGPRHQLLGYPDPIQSIDMELECQLASHGLYCGNESGYKDPRAAGLQAGAADWRLLLQIDSDEVPGWMWGDAGRIYYWIQQQALQARTFDHVWLILQCY
jgi:uncharacterized protein YwqG